MNPISSFFAGPSRSNLQEVNLSSSLPTSNPACLPTTSASQYHVEHCQTTEESEIGVTSSRTSLSDDHEEMADLLSDDIINDEGSASLKPCRLEEPAASCRNLDDDRNCDVDVVQCTPAFGSIGSPVQLKSHFQLYESDDRNSIQDGSIRSTNPSEDLEPATLIQCSPVEHSISVPSEAEICHQADEKASRVVQLRLAFPPSTETQMSLSSGTSGMTAKPTSQAPKLKDLWQRNVIAQSGVKRAAWGYKQEEIDEEVLVQLPAEIQLELRNSWKLNRSHQRRTKRPSISDFFPSSK